LPIGAFIGRSGDRRNDAFLNAALLQCNTDSFQCHNAAIDDCPMNARLAIANSAMDSRRPLHLLRKRRQREQNVWRIALIVSHNRATGE
jgi:hypothetical protein